MRKNLRRARNSRLRTAQSTARAFVAAVVLLPGMAATQVIEPTGKVYSLCVRYAEAVSLTSADVQDVLQQASQFLSHQTAPACKTVSLKSDGTVAKSSGPDTLSE